MRIIHEVHGPMCSSGGGNIQSGLAHLFACSDSKANHPDLPDYLFGDDEVIEIEGEFEYLYAMLQAWLYALDSFRRKRHERKEKELGAAQSR